MATKPGNRTLRAGLLAVGLSFSIWGCDRKDNDWDVQAPGGNPDLAVANSIELEAGGFAHEGAMVRYVIDVRNNGDWDADGVVVMDSLPEQVTLTTIEADRGVFDPETGRWTVGTLAPDSSATLALSVILGSGTLGQVVSNEASVVTVDPADSEPQDNRATVAFVVVNGPPEAADDAYLCTEGETLTVTAPGILGNDGDREGEPIALDVEPVTGPRYGALTLHADGGFVYAHDGAEARVDSFRYVIADASAEVDTGLVTVTIGAVNDPPLAVPDAFTVDEGGRVVGNVAANDADAEDDPLTAVLDAGPRHAAAFSFAADGSFSYIHDGGEQVEDSFVYHVHDGTDASAAAAVAITIVAANDPPTVGDIPDQTVDEGGAFTSIALDGWVTDPDHPDAAIDWSVTGADDLVVVLAGGGSVATIAAPDPDWSGVEILVFRATDPGGAWDEDAAAFRVRSVNDPPILEPIPDQTVLEGGSFEPISLDPLVRDVDHPDAVLEWSVSGATALAVFIDAGHRLHVTPPGPDWYGAETLALRVSDPEGLAASTAVVFTVASVNDAPVMTPLPNQSAPPGGQFLPIMLDNFVSDVDHADAELDWTYAGNGPLLVTIDAARVATVSPPDSGWTGSVTITFRATDPGGLWDERESRFEITATGVLSPAR